MTHYDQAMLLADKAQWFEALELLKKAKEITPDCPVVKRMLSTALLTTGNIKEGLKEFECRFDVPLSTSPSSIIFSIGPKLRKRYKLPYWNGELNKNVYVFSEGGYGDIIQNIRYIPELKNRCKKIVFECKKELCSLMECMNIDLIPAGSASHLMFFEKPPDLRGFDYVVSLHSLMYYFDPELSNICCKPYLKANKTYCKSVEIVKDCHTKLKLGIVWAGNKGHGNDYNRSFYQKYFSKLHHKDIQLFSLQKEPQNDMYRIWQGKEVNLLENSDVKSIWLSLNDFNETALVLKELDGIVCVDTSVAHLAGAIGVPTWLVLPEKKYTEWRWQKQWYQTHKQFHLKDNHTNLMQEVFEDIKLHFSLSD